MPSDVQIINAALVKLGHDLIQSRLDDSDQARAADTLYDICRDDTLAAHDWNFATKRAQLGELAVTLTTDEWTHAYSLPTDCIRISYIEPKGTEYAVENGRIYTDHDSPIQVVYIARITDSGIYSANFVGAFVYRLCMELTTAITARDGYMKDFSQLYLLAIRDAKATDGLEGTGVIEDSNPLGDVRRFSNTSGPDHSGWPWW